MTDVIEKIECLEKTKKEEEELLLEVESPIPVKRQKGRPKKVIEEVDVNSEPKPKRVMSDRQKEILQKAREKKMENFQKREDERALVAQEKEKEVEKRILKKAVFLKKKEIVQQAILENDLDDDIPQEIVEKIIKKQRAKRATPVPKVVVSEPEPVKSKYTFV